MTARPDAAAFFDDRTLGYDRHYDEATADGHALRARLRAALRLIGDGPGSVLDAGMGPGRLCAALDARGWTVSGIDASGQMVEATRARLPQAAGRLQQAEIEALPFPDATFDSVTATGVLEYADLTPALSELARVLRPGGRAVVSYPNPRAVYGIWKTRVWYPAMRVCKRLLRQPDRRLPRGGRPVPPERFVALLEAAGLRVDTFEPTSYLPVPAPLDILLPRLAARAGARLEGGRGGALLATQVVYAARKPGMRA